MAQMSTDPSNHPSREEENALLALFSKGQYAEAAALAQAMTARFPWDAFGWKALGAIFRRLGRNADALASVQKAIALSPKDAEAHNNLGNLLGDFGRRDEAMAS